MNLRGVANSITRAINPNVLAVVSISTGATTNADGSRSPTYDQVPFDCQVQALTYDDLKQIDGLNIQGVRRAIYVNGAVSAVIRPRGKGGDLVTFPPGTLAEGDTWLVVHVLEQWSGWAKFVVTLQDDS